MALTPATRIRLIGAAVLVGCSTLLALATWLTPNPRGYGTHQQLGFAPCGMLLSTGLPCPTCGMTTAFSYTMHGQWLRAAEAQPGGFILALLTGIAAVFAAYALLTGRAPPNPARRWSPFLLFSMLMGLLLLGWGWKLFSGLYSGELPAQHVGL